MPDHFDFRTELLRAKSEWAALEVHVALFKLMCLADMKQMEQRAHNPNQPRDALGRWAGGGGIEPNKVTSQEPTKPEINYDGNGACFEQCKHLMYIGHGNEYRACYLKCLRENSTITG